MPAETPPSVPAGAAPAFELFPGIWVRLVPLPGGSMSLLLYQGGFWIPIPLSTLTQAVPGFKPGSGPFRPFPGGSVYRVPSGGGLEVFTPGEGGGSWGAGPFQAESTTRPTTPPVRGFVPPAAYVAPKGGMLAVEAAYNSFSALYDAIQAVIATNKELEETAKRGDRYSIRLARIEDWSNWIKTNSLGQQLADTMACIANSIAALQGEIDRILAIPSETRGWAEYNHLALLQMALTNMQNHVNYVRLLRTNFITYGGELPSTDQVNSVTCTPIPLEQAPIPHPVLEMPPEFIVPDAPPVGNGPIFPGLATPPTLPLGVDAALAPLIVTLNDLQERIALAEAKLTG